MLKVGEKDPKTFSLQLYFCTFASARVTQISKAMQNTAIRTVANIKKELFDFLFDNGIHLVHGLRANMKNKLMPMRERILLRKMYVIECIDELLKNKACLVHSRHRSVLNFIMNICSALTAYCFFDNKPEALPVSVVKNRQLELF